MRTLICSLFAGLGLLVLSPSVAEACSCRPAPGPTEAMQGSDLVFEGTVVGIPAAPGESAPPSFGKVEYRFQVKRSWKGSPGMDLRVQTNASGAACGRQYKKGETYIVYATLSDDVVRDSLCSRTRTLASAEEDLAAFGEGVVPHARGGARPGPPVNQPGDEPGSEPGEPGGEPTNVEAGDAQTGDGETAETPDAGAETSQPAGEETAVSEPATAQPPEDTSVAQTGDEGGAPDEDEDDELPKKKGCSVSSADVGNTLGVLLLAMAIVGVRRRL